MGWDPTSSTILLPAMWVVVLVVLVLFLRKQQVHRDSLARRSMAEPTDEKTMQSTLVEAEPLVALGAIRAAHQDRLSRLDERRSEINFRLTSLDSLDLERATPKSTIARASLDERRNLTEILAIDSSSSAEAIVEEIRRYGSHSVASWLRGQHVPYAEVLHDVATKMGHRPMPGGNDFELERAVVEATFKKMVGAASPEQRRQIERELARQNNASAVRLGTTAGGLAVAQLSGFALYTAASSSLAAISGAVGLTLPFAAYTGMSSVIATVTGPIGWATLGAWALFKLGGPNFKRTVPAALAVASIRARNIAERDEEKVHLLQERDGDLARHAADLDRLTAWLWMRESLESNSWIPRSEVPAGFGF